MKQAPRQFKNDFKDFKSQGPPPKVSADATTVFIGNISFRASKESLESVFAGIPTFKEVRLITDRETGRMKGYGYAEFFDAKGVESALALTGTDVEGRALNINPAENKRKFDGPR